MSLPVVDKWMHVTSKENLKDIVNSDLVMLYGNTSEYYDGVLYDKTSPHGVWFHANYYNGNLFDQSVYPEKCEDIYVRGIVFKVADLLKGKVWKMYFISEVQVGCRQVKVAFVVENSPEHCWFLWMNQQCSGEFSNIEKYKEVVNFDPDYNTFRAMEYVSKGTMVSVFYCPMHGENIPYGLKCEEPRVLTKVSGVKKQSPGELSVGHLQSILNEMNIEDVTKPKKKPKKKKKYDDEEEDEED